MKLTNKALTVILGVVAVAGNAYAQTRGSPTYQTLSVVGATTTAGITDSGGINTTAATGYRVGGANGLFVTPGNAGQQGVFIGPNAGSYIQSNGVNISFGALGIGIDSLASLQSGGAETNCGGPYSCQYAVNPYGMTGWGEHVIGYDNCSGCSAFGNDAMRDVVGNTNSSAFGAQSQDDGTGSSNTTQGFQALLGNGGSIIVGGTKTAGDVLHIAFTTTNMSVTGLPATASYTVQSSDTLTTIASGLVSAISALGVTTPGGGPSPGNGVSLAGNNNGPGGSPGPVIAMHFPGGNTTGWAITPTTSCTGTCTETLTVNAPFTGTNNLANGVGALLGLALTSGSKNDARGDGALSNLQGSSSSILCYGYSCGASAISGGTSVVMGTSQLVNATSITNCVVMNGGALTSMTSCAGNTLLNGGNDITTGQNNLEAGYGATVNSPTANWQFSIMDGVYGTNCNKGGGGSANCQVGISQPNPGAKLDVLGYDTSSGTTAFRIQNSALTNLLSVTDSGGITVGASAGVSCSGTPTSSFASTNGIVTHC